ncbi:uncharacterized protein LOC142073636 isoform X2 [Calonectris borealis]
MVAWLQEDKQQNEVLHQEIKQLEEALEQEEICQQQRKKEAEAPGTVLPEVVEAQLVRGRACASPCPGQRGSRWGEGSREVTATHGLYSCARRRPGAPCNSRCPDPAAVLDKCPCSVLTCRRETCWRGDAASFTGCSECPHGSPVPCGPLPGSRWDGPDTCSSRQGSQAAGEPLAGCGLCSLEVLSIGFPWAGVFSQAGGLPYPTLPKGAMRNVWGGSPWGSQNDLLHPEGKMGLGCIHPALSLVPLQPHRTLCLLLVGLQLAVGFALAAAVLYASWYDPELFYRLLLRVLCEETYAHLAYALGEILPVVSEGLLPF